MEKLRKIIKKAIGFAYMGAKHRIGAYAAQASFFFIISAVPFLMFLLSVSKFLLQYFMEISEEYIITQINLLLPQAVGGYIEEMLHEVFANSSGISVITAFTTLWLASRGVMAIYQGVCNVLDNGRLRSYFYARAASVIYTLLLVVMMVLMLAVFGMGDGFMTWFAEKFPTVHSISLPFLKMRELTFFVILTLLFASFYKFMPRDNTRFSRLLPGAALAAAGWILFSWVYSIYTRHSSYASIYGSLTSLVLIMLWLYFCMNILLYGAEFNHALKNGYFKKNV